MKPAVLVVFLFVVASSRAQVPQSAQPPTSSPTTAPNAVNPVLQQLQQTAQAVTADVSRVRIEKWKTDNSTKQQAQEMATSVSRNVNSALPELIQAARTQPSSVAAQFKLYHNVTALYETLASLTETAGAFGGKQEFDALSSDANRLDAQRRSLADYLQNLAAQNDTALANFRAQAARAAAAAAAAPPKKIVVDDEKPAPAKKKATATKKPAASTMQQPPE